MNEKKYKSISEVAQILNLVDKKTGKLSTHTLRFWEKEFKQLNPKIFAGRRRYYDNNSIEVLKKIQFLLKEKGMTIKGVKKLLNSNETGIDEINNLSIKAKNIKNRLEKISNLLRKLKN
tara:strand:+ start:797 stop:1153 length:357 start_codon:yes stop_codon:yes gene_type:complete